MTPLAAAAHNSHASPAPLPVRLQALWREGWRYGATSALALAVDTASYALAYRLGAPLAVAIALGFASGLAVAYAGSVMWVFHQHRLQDRRAEFAAFALIGLIGLLLTQGGLWWLVGEHQWPAIPAKLLMAGMVFACNFTLRKLLLFSRREPAAA